MGGKTLKFPVRQKYVRPDRKNEESKEEAPLSEEEEKKRIELLKRIGLLKEKKEEE